MEFIKISNKGLLDIRLISLMGGSTKRNDKYKIGQFGTGFKYFISYCVRNNIDVRIAIDGEELKLTHKREVIQEIDFDIIYVNNERTSITSDMGLEWKAWMIMREIWCNALDEEDSKLELVNNVDLQKDQGRTSIYVQNTGEIKEVYENWDKYFIHGQTPLQDEKSYALYKGGEEMRIYKNGVLIKTFDQKSVFAYDFKDASINEMREYNGSADVQISYFAPSYNKESVEYLLNNIKGTWEDEMSYDWFSYEKFGEGWGEAIGADKIIDYDTYKKIEGKFPEIKDDAIIQVPKTLFKKIYDQFPSISLVRASDKMHTFYETYSDHLTDKINRSVIILEEVGYFIDPELKIIQGVFGNSDIQAQVSMDQKEIRICQDMEQLSDIEMIYALIEENEHFKSGFDDCTRAFQSHFIKLYANELMGDKVRVHVESQ